MFNYVNGRRFLIALGLYWTTSSVASAHFVWIAPGAEEDKVQVVFGEQPLPGEPQLRDKIAQTKLAVVDQAGKSTIVELKQLHDNAWQGAGQGDNWQARCDYGVVDHGEKFQLYYYARMFRGEPSTWTTSDAARMPLDANLALQDDKLTVSVSWQGKPAAQAEIVLVAPEQTTPHTTNEEGKLELPQVQEGRLALRVMVSEPGTGSELPVKHYLTIVADVPPIEFAEADPVATKLLADARAERAVWGKYNELSCQVEAVTSDGTEKFGVTISNSGDVTLVGAAGPTKEWLEAYTASMMQHRAPGEPGEETVRFVSEVAPHPLGQKLALGDELGSHYRIHDRKVMEVNRDLGPGAHFQISVLKTVDNPAGKYLPAAFTIVTWDGEEIVSSLAEVDTWTRIAECDVPATVVQMITEGQETKVYHLRFTNWQDSAVKTANR